MSTTPSRLASQMKNIPRKLQENKDQIEIPGLDRLLGSILTRVFTNGIATDGLVITSKVAKNQVGVYGKQQGNKRAKAGKNTGRMNLSFSSGLRNNIKRGKTGEDNSLGFLLDKYRVIMDGHESYRKKLIVQPTEQEMEDAIEVNIQAGLNVIKKCLSGG